ncbi:MAG: hypothetical protein H7X95_00360 [Deltaproteobacteria bacterium]|nr:hypothetical protein [Deltaproteobacteria bacterium]
MRRVLASGCVDGFAELKELSASRGPTGEIATEIARLCSGVRTQSKVLDSSRSASAPSIPAAGQSLPATAGASALGLDRRGRSRLVPALTLYGIWAGIAFDVLADIDGDRAIVLFPLLGMAGGLAGSLLATQTGEITSGQAWSIITGLEYGTVSGLLWAGAADASTDKGIVGTGLVAGVAGGGLGLLVARYRPRAGAVEMVRSGGIWGTATALMLALMSPSEPSSQAMLTTLAIGLDAGMLGGAVLASRIPISVSRMLLIDAGALAGLGFGLGATWLIAGSDGHRQMIGAGGLVGLLVGIGTAVVLTGDMDSNADALATATPTFPALVVRDPRGHFSLGSFALAPVVGPPGSRRAVTGATATLFGGTF